MWAIDDSTWVECEHGAVCASSGEGQQCRFAGTVCSRPGCVTKAQEWWVPIVSAAKQHVTASDGVVHAGGATARAAFSSTDWSPPSQTPSLKGEARQVFLDQCSHWYHTPKAKMVPCRVLRVEPSGKAWVRFWAAERAVSQQRLKREPTAAEVRVETGQNCIPECGWLGTAHHPSLLVLDILSPSPTLNTRTPP